jgi:hypothetical protein
MIQKGPIPFPVTDLIVWEETNGQLIVKEPLSPLQYNPYLQKDYFQKGDQMENVNYIPFSSKQAFEEFLHHLNPGSVALYKIKRGNRSEKRFVFIAPQPHLLWANASWLWDTATLVHLIFVILLSFVFFVFIPFKGPSSIFFYFHYNILLFFLIAVQLLRYLVYYLDFHFEYTDLKLTLYYTYVVLLITLSLYLLWSILANPQDFWSFSISLIAAMLIAFGVVLVFLPKIPSNVLDVYEYGVLGSDTLLLFGMMIRFLKKWWKAITIFFGVTLFSSFLVFLSVERKEILHFHFYLSAFALLLIGVWWLKPYVRFIKMIRPGIGFIILFSSFIGLYVLFHRVLGTFAHGSIVRNILELLFVLLSYGSFYLLYQLGGNLIPRIFKFQTQPANRLLRWVTALSHYTDPQLLINDFQEEVKDYFRADHTLFIENPPVGSLYNELLNAIKNQAHSNPKEDVLVWAKDPFLNEITLPESLLKEAKAWDFIFVFTTEQSHSYCLCLKMKFFHSFGIDDIQFFKDVFRQVVLYLELLYHVEEEKALKEKTLQAELQALRSQINPHFLFNTLNTISALIHEQPKLAEEAVEHLAHLFRKTLQVAENQLIPLKSELELIRDYLAIEKIRFGDRLQIRYEIDEGCENVAIPPLLLQTIVENAIKHGAAKTVGDAIVSIRIRDQNHSILIEIEDNGPGIDLSKIESSTGLRNIISRLKAQFHRRDLIHFFNTGNGTCIRVKIPKFEH